MNKKFRDHYNGWRNTRINKVFSILGNYPIKNKSILELASGLGYIGNFFQSLGANVTCTDGRSEYVEYIKKTFPSINTFVLDQNTNWNLNKTYDIIIHWGVLYHIEHWEEDISTALNHFNDYLFLESEVTDSDNPNMNIITYENGYDQALNGIGSRPSPANIERVITLTGFKFQRFDDIDLNYGQHRYDWEILNTNTTSAGLRRFWVITK